MGLFVFFFFFFKQKTAYEMVMSDWSSDVCSSDLRLATLDPSGAHYVIDLVDLLIDEARNSNASDIHLLPTSDGLLAKYRIDGVLQPAAMLPTSVAANVVARLKVLADLMTY